MAKLILKEVGPNRSKVLFLLRNWSGLSLIEYKKIMDSVPYTLMEDDTSIINANLPKYWLEELGAVVEYETNEVAKTAAIVTAYYRGQPIEQEMGQSTKMINDKAQALKKQVIDFIKITGRVMAVARVAIVGDEKYPHQLEIHVTEPIHGYIDGAHIEAINVAEECVEYSSYHQDKGKIAFKDMLIEDLIIVLELLEG